jgi:S1-C subfamily serine protease
VIKKFCAALCVSVVVFLLACATAASRVNDPDQAQHMMVEYGQQVFMLTQHGFGSGGGTGFAIRMPDGSVLTVSNKHVCNISLMGTMQATQGNFTKALKVLKVSEDDDLCLLEGYPHATGLRISEYTARVNEVVTVLGYPFLRPLTPSQGMILFPWPGFENATNVEVHPGNSGSPMLNRDGYVVGVIYAMDIRTNHAFYVSLDALKKFLIEYTEGLKSSDNAQHTYR